MSALAVVASACLLFAGCGTRVAHDDLEAAFVGAPSSTASGVAAPLAGQTSGAPALKGAAASAGSGAAAAGGPQSAQGPSGAALGPAGTKNQQAPAGGCTGKEQPIKIGSVGAQSGVVGSVVGPGPKAVAAWASYMNSRGGLKCHKIIYKIADSGGNSSKNAALTKQLVEQDGVVAFVMNNDPLGFAGSQDYLVQKRIPVIGGEAGNQAFYRYPTWFPQVAQGDVAILASLVGMAQALDAEHRAAAAVVSCQEATMCSRIGKLAPQYAKRAGLKIVYQTQASITAPNYTSVCLNAQRAGAKAVLIALDGNSMRRFAKSCESVNYHPIYGSGGPAVTEDMAQEPTFDGMRLPVLANPWTNNANRAVAEYNAVLARYAPGVPNVGQAEMGWVAAKLFEAAGAFLPAKNTITSADIVAAMDQLKNNDLGGLTGPLTFTAGKPAPQTACVYTMAIKGGRFVTMNDARRTCI